MVSFSHGLVIHNGNHLHCDFPHHYRLGSSCPLSRKRQAVPSGSKGLQRWKEQTRPRNTEAANNTSGRVAYHISLYYELWLPTPRLNIIALRREHLSIHQIPSERDFCLYATRHSHNPQPPGLSSTFFICFPTSGCTFVAELSLITIAAASAGQVRISPCSRSSAGIQL